MIMTSAVDAVREQIAALEERQHEIDGLLAADVDERDLTALVHEQSVNGARLRELQRHLPDAEAHDRVTAKQAALDAYRVKMTTLYALYQQAADLDAEYTAIEAQRQQVIAKRAALNPKITLESNRLHGRLMQAARAAGAVQADLDAIRRDFTPIAVYF